MAVMTFDIETVPDIASCRKLLDLNQTFSDEDVFAAMLAKRREAGKSEFLPPHLQQVVAISVAVRQDDWFKVWSLGDVDSDERGLVQRFYNGIAKYQPTLVSWNGSGFDLPVLHYRALKNKVVAKQYWETGQTDQGFKWNNYINRYHDRHLDLMDVLAAFQTKSFAKLDDICMLLDLPGKMGESGSQVYDKYLSQDIQGIRNYCETDVLNTYLVYLHVEHMRGFLTDDMFLFEYDVVKKYVEEAKAPHLQAYREQLGVPSL